MKKFFIWYIVSAAIMFVLYILYRNGLTINLVFYRKDGHTSWVQGFTAQFMHFSFFHYLCNIWFYGLLLKELKNNYCFLQIVFTEIISMIFVAAALLLFAQSEQYYAGFSGIVLGLYSLLMMQKILNENNNSERWGLIVDGIVFVIISIIMPNVSILMHIAGMIAGIICYFLFEILISHKNKESYDSQDP